ncbi:MAG: hypothetical protein MUO72_01715 [Bacteroidales bacterium]|nr:hypothetical protein [Bacteroidales bacterium]
MKETILKSYDQKRGLYDEFRSKIEVLCTEILKLKGIVPHLIVSRTKTRSSLSKKIDDKSEKYNKLEDITDIAGLRIITFLESEIETIAGIIKKEFQIDPINSIDKRKHEADQFGYKSLHYVVSIKQSRCKLTEYKKFANLKCEIQLRSILQHAWAEIEHDLGYKGEQSIPFPYRRGFSRISALLETADREFDRLKIDLTNYEKDLKTLIKTHPEEIELNQASLLSILKTNKVLQECKNILLGLGITLVPTSDLKMIIQKFEFFNINTIKELEDSLKDNKSLFIQFFRDFLKDRITDTLSDIIPLFFFLHFLAAKKEDLPYILEYFDYGEKKISYQGKGHIKILELYKKIKYTC